MSIDKSLDNQVPFTNGGYANPNDMFGDLDDLGPVVIPTSETISTNPINILSEMSELEDMDFEDHSCDAQSDEESNDKFNFKEFMFDVQKLLPEFETYYENNKQVMIEQIFDKSVVDEMKSDNGYYKENGHEQIRFETDDAIIKTIMNYLLIDTLSTRLDVLKEYYRNQMIGLYEQSVQEDVSLDLPVISVVFRGGNSTKTEISQTPAEFFDSLKKMELIEKFNEAFSKIDTAKLGKTPMDKIVELMKKSKNEDAKALYEEMDKRNLVKTSKTIGSYAITNKIK